MPVCKRERDRAESQAVVAEVGSAVGVSVGSDVSVGGGAEAVGVTSTVTLGEGSAMDVGLAANDVAVARTTTGFAPGVGEAGKDEAPLGEDSAGTRSED